MVDRKNRDLKPRPNMLEDWAKRLPTIRFAMNSMKRETTGFSAATFTRDLRTPDKVHHDLRKVVQENNFIQ